MSKSKLTPSEARELIIAKLSHNFGVTPADATDEHYYKAIALVLRDIMHEQQKKFTEAALKEKSKTVYYLCMEFLMGRALGNNLINGIGEWPDTNDWYLFLTWGYPVGVLIFIVICAVTWLLGLAMRKLHQTQA